MYHVKNIVLYKEIFEYLRFWLKTLCSDRTSLSIACPAKLFFYCRQGSVGAKRTSGLTFWPNSGRWLLWFKVKPYSYFQDTTFRRKNSRQDAPSFHVNAMSENSRMQKVICHWRKVNFSADMSTDWWRSNQEEKSYMWKNWRERDNASEVGRLGGHTPCGEQLCLLWKSGWRSSKIFSDLMMKKKEAKWHDETEDR